MGESKIKKCQDEDGTIVSVLTEWNGSGRKQLLNRIKSSQKSDISVNKLYCVGHKLHRSQWGKKNTGLRMPSVLNTWQEQFSMILDLALSGGETGCEPTLELETNRD